MKNGTNIFLYGVSRECPKSAIEREFQRYGKVNDINISERLCGYFITMDKKNEAEDAINALNGSQIDGHDVDVTIMECKSQADPRDAFDASYNFVTSTNVEGQAGMQWLNHLVMNCNSSSVAATICPQPTPVLPTPQGVRGLTKTKIVIYDTNTLSVKTSFWAHEGKVFGLRFSHGEENIIYSCSPQDCIKMWDIRQSQKPARSFIDTSIQQKDSDGQLNGISLPKKPLICLDVNKNDSFLVGGTEQVGKDAFLLFWDIGSGKMLRWYWKSFEDDLTTVAFHPDDSDKLATGGIDGRINVFDVSQTTEKDALLTSMNTESSIDTLTWYKNKGNDGIAASCSKEIVLWTNIDGIQPHTKFTREDITISMRRNRRDYEKQVIENCYLVGTHYKKDTDQLMVLTASTSPCHTSLRVSTIKKNKLESHADLKYCCQLNCQIEAAGYSHCGFSTFCFDSLSNAIFTGNGFGDVALWKAT